jgi:hypothetical protein
MFSQLLYKQFSGENSVPKEQETAEAAENELLTDESETEKMKSGNHRDRRGRIVTPANLD